MGNPVSPSDIVIDREKVCPFLLRVFCKYERHNNPDVYLEMVEKPVDNEIHIYTWLDATFRELCELVQNSSPEPKNLDKRMDFSLVYPNNRGKYSMKHVGWCYCNRHRKNDLQNKTLASIGFEIGDYLDISIE